MFSRKYEVEELKEYSVSCYSRYLAMTNNNISEDYIKIPDIKDFVSKINIKDFRIENIGMYIRRWLETKGVF